MKVADDNDLNEGNESEGGALRKQLEKALKANKEMSDKLASMEATQRTSLVEKALSEKGLSPKLAKFVSAEDGSDPARLDTWIKENAELFGTPNPPAGETGGQPSVDAETQNAFGQIQKVSESGSHVVTDMAALNQQIKNAKNPAELEQIMAAYRIS